jgi:hypothetical protein
MPDGMGMPAPSWDSLVEETRVATRRRRRRRRQRWMLWLLTLVTTGALAVIGLFVVKISKVRTAASPAALSASAQTVSHGTVPKASRAAHRVPPGRGHPTAVTYPQVTDTASGLSYRLLPRPWQQGCPSDLTTPMFSWSAGENTVAGHVSIGGSLIDWHGLACSGRLQQQFTYAGRADLAPTAMSLVGALDPAYYAGVPHSRTIQDSTAMQVSGHQAWMVEFGMNYPDGASQGLTWSSELGAVVVVDRGALQAPAVFYVSVPANLGPQKVTMLVDSLRMS